MDELATRDRVRNHTPITVNQRIDRATERAIARSSAGGGEAIRARPSELRREWDVDRAVLLAFPIAGGASLLAGLRRGRVRRNGWLVFFGVQMGFLAWHALVGWCPPAATFRRLGFRTRDEIAVERQRLERQLGELRPGSAPTA